MIVTLLFRPFIAKWLHTQCRQPSVAQPSHRGARTPFQPHNLQVALTGNLSTYEYVVTNIGSVKKGDESHGFEATNFYDVCSKGG
jgi:hypothetical protein